MKLQTFYEDISNKSPTKSNKILSTFNNLKPQTSKLIFTANDSFKNVNTVQNVTSNIKDPINTITIRTSPSKFNDILLKNLKTNRPNSYVYFTTVHNLNIFSNTTGYTFPPSTQTSSAENDEILSTSKSPQRMTELFNNQIIENEQSKMKLKSSTFKTITNRKRNPSHMNNKLMKSIWPSTSKLDKLNQLEKKLKEKLLFLKEKLRLSSVKELEAYIF